jgi:proteic killer suppression protein
VHLEFQDDDLRRLYVETRFRLAWMGSDLTKLYRRKVQLLAAAVDERDLRHMRSLHFEKLVADRAGQYSIRLNDKYRLIFRLRTGDDGRTAIIIEVVDYH